MEITVAMRAHRSLRKLPRYRSATEWELILKEVIPAAGLGAGEDAIGFYQNTPQSTDNGILITNRGLHVHYGHSWKFVSYSEIVSVELEGGEKSLEVDNLAIRLRNGETELVPFLGGDSTLGTRDIFAPWTFLKNVLADILHCNSTSDGK
jgi:hypothetical protein